MSVISNSPAFAQQTLLVAQGETLSASDSDRQPPAPINDSLHGRQAIPGETLAALTGDPAIATHLYLARAKPIDRKELDVFIERNLDKIRQPSSFLPGLAEIANSLEKRIQGARAIADAASTPKDAKAADDELNELLDELAHMGDVAEVITEKVKPALRAMLAMDAATNGYASRILLPLLAALVATRAPGLLRALP